MKKIIFLLTVIFSVSTYSQSLGYDDLGVMFAKDDNFGTARFEAMSGAFGALGGDLSSVHINPAGGAVARRSNFSITAGNTSVNSKANYYGAENSLRDNSFNLSQIGGVLVFGGAKNSNWNNFAISFNYKMKSDFNKSYSVKGNSGFALFNQHPSDKSNPTNKYNKAKEQYFSNTYSGESGVFNIGLSSVYQNKLYIGGGVNIHSFKLDQVTNLTEVNLDDKGNELTAFNEQTSAFEATGVSLSVGFIYKTDSNFRFGLAYETPTWYSNVIEENNLVEDPVFDDWLFGFTEIKTNDLGAVSAENETRTNEYSLKTQGRLTASGAYVFAKKGLLSIDYTYKNYKGIKYIDENDINENLESIFKATHSFNIGTEWRFDKVSVRGGYHYEQSPYENTKFKGNLNGFSLGAGYNFGKMKIDLSYRNSNNNSSYEMYDSRYPRDVKPIEIKNNNSRIIGTVTFSL
ncbi:MAG: outer membrane protein transport protein [Tenacibaculum sp.]|nr:outer membrane protein transport protein [Tenacibaculum sp.]